MDESDTDLYKPFKYYYEKQSKKEENQDITDLIQSWSKLDNEKKLKFIKKAESKFDKEHENQTITKDNCFSNYLNNIEMKLLMDSYGFVEKPPQYVRQYFFKKHHEELEDGQNFLVETQKKFVQLSQEEKDSLFDELASMEEDYCRKMTQFLDNLPENRFIDYRKYLQHHEIHSEKKKSKKKPKPKTAPATTTTTSDTPAKPAPKRRQRAIKYMHPYEFYYKKNEDKFLQDGMPVHEAMKQARSYYLKNLSNKKKLKFIKKCEEHYDELISNEGDRNKNMKPLSALLNKNELEILFESYGLPKVVPKAPTSYYLKLYYNEHASANPENKNVMGSVMTSYKALDVNAKNEFLQKHQEDSKAYAQNLELFKRNLPLQRLGDYLRYEGHEKKSETATNGTTSISIDHNDLNKKENKKRKLNEESDHDQIVSEVETNVEDDNDTEENTLVNDDSD